MLFWQSVLEGIKPRVVFRLEPKGDLIVDISALIGDLKENILKDFIFNERADHALLQIGNRSVDLVEHEQVHCFFLEGIFPDCLGFFRVFILNMMHFLSFDVLSIENLLQKRNLTQANVDHVPQEYREMHSQFVGIKLPLQLRQIIQVQFSLNYSVHERLELLIEASVVDDLIDHWYVFVVRIASSLLVFAAEKHLTQSDILQKVLIREYSVVKCRKMFQVYAMVHPFLRLNLVNERGTLDYRKHGILKQRVYLLFNIISIVFQWLNEAG